MLKRISRYTPLILTLLLAGVWVDNSLHSKRHVTYTYVYEDPNEPEFVRKYRKKSIYIEVGTGPGVVYVSKSMMQPLYQPAWEFYHTFPADITTYPDQKIVWRHFGVAIGKSSGYRATAIFVRIDVMLVPLLLLTVFVWYRPYKTWRQRRLGHGFEVQPRTGESQGIPEAKT